MLFENKQYQDPYVLFPYLKEKISGEGMFYVLLDEVQLLDQFESVLNSLLHMRNVDIYVTGSNAHFLSKDVITEFRGRGDEVHMHLVLRNLCQYTMGRNRMDGMNICYTEDFRLY